MDVSLYKNALMFTAKVKLVFPKVDIYYILTWLTKLQDGPKLDFLGCCIFTIWSAVFTSTQKLTTSVRNGYHTAPKKNKEKNEK